MGVNNSTRTLNPCVAHRGWSGAAPENTRSAILLAVEDPEIEMIEIDVQLSKDGVPIIIHDFVLDRTTNGSGMVKDHTLEELEQLDAGSWLDPQYIGEKIPTFAEVLQLVKGKKRLNIELKQAVDKYPHLEEKVVELIRKHHMEEEVILTSFDHLSLKKVKQLAPELQVGLIILGRPSLIVEQMEDVGATILSMEYHYITKEIASTMEKRNWDIIAWTINNQQDLTQVAQIHPSIMLCTNYPDLWKQLHQ